MDWWRRSKRNGNRGGILRCAQDDGLRRSRAGVGRGGAGSEEAGPSRLRGDAASAWRASPQGIRPRVCRDDNLNQNGRARGAARSYWWILLRRKSGGRAAALQKSASCVADWSSFYKPPALLRGAERGTLSETLRCGEFECCASTRS